MKSRVSTNDVNAVIRREKKLKKGLHFCGCSKLSLDGERIVLSGWIYGWFIS